MLYRPFKFALSVRPSVTISFPLSVLSIPRQIFFKFWIIVDTDEVWFGIVDGQISSNKHRVITLYSCRKLVAVLYLAQFWPFVFIP